MIEAYFSDYKGSNGLLLGRSAFALLHFQIIDDIMKKYSLVSLTAKANNKCKSQNGSTNYS